MEFRACWIRTVAVAEFLALPIVVRKPGEVPGYGFSEGENELLPPQAFGGIEVLDSLEYDGGGEVGSGSIKAFEIPELVPMAVETCYVLVELVVIELC